MIVSIHSMPGVDEDALDFWREQLAVQDPWAGIASSPEWFTLSTGDPSRTPMVAVARDTSGEVQAVIPVVFVESRTGFLLSLPRSGRRVLTARVCGGDILSTTSSLPQLGEIWGALFHHIPTLEAIVLDHLGMERLPAVEQSCSYGNPFFLLTPTPPKPHYRLVLPRTFEDLKSLRSPSSVKKIFGRERRLAREVGQTTTLELRSPGDWAPYSVAINRMMNATWQAKHLGHGFDIDEHRSIASAGWFRSYLLLAGVAPAAFVLGYQAGRIFTYEQIGFAPDLASYSPGTILLLRTLEGLYVRDTPECVEFGEGDALYKREWSNQSSECQSVLVVRRSMHWRLAGATSGLYWLLRRTVRASLEATGLRRRLVRYLKSR